mgnify:CR=1 FL=1
MRVNIIGGGLAGCALAFTLKQAGAEPVIYEASDTIASGASGNDVGLYNPRFTAQFDAVGQFYSKAFFEALKLFWIFGDDIDWNPCGALHLINDDKKARRFPKTVESWGWDEKEMRIISALEASEVSGVPIAKDCLFLANSGFISPKKLCHRYVEGVKIWLNTPVSDLSDLDGVTVLACGMGCLAFDQAAHIPLKAVRGQITCIGETETSRDLKTTIGYGGYIAPSKGGAHCLGATFQRWLDHSDLLPEDDQANLDKLSENVPALKGVYFIKAARASVRTTASDHFPVVGQLDENTYISAAHGSHGILSSLLSAKILTNNVINLQCGMGGDVLSALSPDRFDRSNAT